MVELSNKFTMENPPFSIHLSIEDPVEAYMSWGQPPPLPVQSEQYSSMLWSNREQSVTVSAPPWTTIMPKCQWTANSTQSPKTKKHLMDDDHLHILWLAIQAGDSYGHGTNKSFWQRIASSFEAATGKCHTTLAWAVNEDILISCWYLIPQLGICFYDVSGCLQYS